MTCPQNEQAFQFGGISFPQCGHSFFSGNAQYGHTR